MDIELHDIELRYALLRAIKPSRYARLLASIAQHGQRDPVLTVETPRSFVLIDGYARVRALLELGHDLVRAVVLDLDEVDALIMTWRLEVTGRRSALEDGWFVADLIDRHGWSQQRVADRLQRSKSWVCRHLALVRTLSPAVQSSVRAGRLPPHAAMKYLVPLARPNTADCDALVKGLGEEPVSVRQIERLYRGYKQADDETRARIVAHPRLFLDALEATREPLEDGDPAAPLIHDFDAIAGISRRARRRVEERLIDELDESRRRLLLRAIRAAQLAFGRVVERVTEESSCSTAERDRPS